MRLPIVNYALIAVIGLAFLYQWTQGESTVALLVADFGFAPGALRRAIEHGWTSPEALGAAATIVSSLFLHQGWFHVAGNLLYLHVFGDNIEERLGRPLYLAFFFAAGAAGALAELTFGAQPEVPVIGASGAIAGVLGAYVVLHPAGRVVTLFPVFVFLTFIELPAVLFPWIWAAQQLLNGYLVLAGVPEAAGIAWFAHLGGFAFGVAVGIAARVVRRRRMRRADPT
ncbi:rhomboid family intramembrane serine protease [Myxococcota bacterium]|nr:rhomboid family intramembrane serine protease [Myxococcota bacterium]